MKLPCLIVFANEVTTLGWLEYMPLYDKITQLCDYTGKGVIYRDVVKVCFSKPSGEYVERKP